MFPHALPGTLRGPLDSVLSTPNSVLGTPVLGTLYSPPPRCHPLLAMHCPKQPFWASFRAILTPPQRSILEIFPQRYCNLRGGGKLGKNAASSSSFATQARGSVSLRPRTRKLGNAHRAGSGGKANLKRTPAADRRRFFRVPCVCEVWHSRPRLCKLLYLFYTAEGGCATSKRWLVVFFCVRAVRRPFL